MQHTTAVELFLGNKGYENISQTAEYIRCYEELNRLVKKIAEIDGKLSKMLEGIPNGIGLYESLKETGEILNTLEWDIYFSCGFNLGLRIGVESAE